MIMSKSNLERSSHVWHAFQHSKINPFGIAGLMGNLYAESGLNPRNLQNSFEKKLGMSDDEYTKAVDSGVYTRFDSDGAGYGLAQWTYPSRKRGLLELCRKKGVSIGDLDTQIEYLMWELEHLFPSLLEQLKSTVSVREASDAVLLQFENPKDHGLEVCDRRYAYSQSYYEQYVDRTTSQHKGGADMTIVDNLTSVNYRQSNRTPEYIVIHYFGGLGTAKNVSDYFKTPGIQASAHYIVDEGDIIYRCVLDKDIAWHCGGKSYVHPYCRNANSIGIEARPKKINGRHIAAADTDWYFDQKTIDHVVWLTKELMRKYNIPADRVIRHYDVTGKLCPRPMCGSDKNQYYGESGDKQWEKFKKRIQEEEDEDMTLDQFKALMKEYRAELQDNDSGAWSAAARDWAIGNGLVSGTGSTINGEPNYAWEDQLTREQAVTLFYRFAKMIGQA